MTDHDEASSIDRSRRRCQQSARVASRKLKRDGKTLKFAEPGSKMPPKSDLQVRIQKLDYELSECKISLDDARGLLYDEPSSERYKLLVEHSESDVRSLEARLSALEQKLHS